jgi:solute carrier family 25 folate transporter 32
MMFDSTSPTLTAFERWAARASDSQFNALAGAVGGFTSGVVTCPLDVIKTKLQAQGGLSAQKGLPRKYNGLVGTATVIWREEGLRGMYRGLGPIILGYLPTWAVWFTIYNKSKTVISQYQSTWLIHLCGSGAVLHISVPPSASHCLNSPLTHGLC